MNCAGKMSGLGLENQQDRPQFSTTGKPEGDFHMEMVWLLGWVTLPAGVVIEQKGWPFWSHFILPLAIAIAVMAYVGATVPDRSSNVALIFAVPLFAASFIGARIYRFLARSSR